MLAGTVMSAVMGGLAGLAYALSQEHGIMQSVLAYQFGGMIAVMAFLASAQAPKVWQS